MKRYDGAMSRLTLRWILVLAATLVTTLPCSLQAQAPPAPVEPAVEAVVETDLGTIRIEFARDKAPRHVDQFLKLAREGFYNGSAFHRAVLNGIIQGGDPLLKDPKTPKSLWGTGGLNLLPREPNDLKHLRGTLSSVSIPNRANSEGAQFFICVTPQPALDGQYTAYGTVTEGMDVVERISQVPLGTTGPSNSLNGIMEKPVRILRVSVEPAKREPFISASAAELKRTVTLDTPLGPMKFAMRPDWAPENVRNFLKLAQSGWYTGTAFHRVAKGFVAQGGAVQSRLGSPVHPADRWVRPVKREVTAEGKHRRGALSMAHGEDPHSATTSFFILLADAPSLDGEYSVFAEIVEGQAVLDAFEKEEVDGETPKRRLEVTAVTIE
jgi:cyclophilin family peptidyl-prolyl cis-trans isomerase